MYFRRSSLPWYGYLILAYALIGIVWWSVLLIRKNQEVFDARIHDLETQVAITHEVPEGTHFEESELYLTEEREFRKQQQMIIWEALLLLSAIIGGIYVIYRNLGRQIAAAEQQRSFLLSITHELKSPIAGIRLILETFQKRPSLPEALKSRLSTNGLKETDRLTQLVNDLLLSAKLETHYQLNPEALDLSALLLETVDKVAAKYPQAEIELQTADDLPFFKGDLAGMTSVVQNLIENAAKYSQPDPHIQVSLQRNGTAELVLSVADNGIGIPDEHKAQIWRKFYRVGSEDTRKTKGTGLGLFIVKELIQLHKGLIELTDNEPRGSKFVVRLPV